MLSLLAFCLILCFCSYLPAVMFVSFLFNALVLGSSLFAALAQEREKRTIDALRLTQLSSLEILALKSRRELRVWKRGNLVLTLLALWAGWFGGVPLGWALSGSVALACCGLLAMALALAVSTQSETTSSAVVSGWVTKIAWLAGLPLLDQVMEAVLVLKAPLSLFCYLDPAWIAWRVVEASLFELDGAALASLWLGAAATVVVAGLIVLHSSRLIDSSFECAATLTDRSRHPVYGKRFVGGLESNPFFVRELAWQIRSGAGRWPGYAVFVTLFLAPFLYGLAQSERGPQAEPVKVVREAVSGLVISAPPSPTEATQAFISTDEGCREVPMVSGGTHQVGSQHFGLCLSQMMKLPIHRSSHPVEPGQRLVVTSSGQVQAVSQESLKQFETPVSTEQAVHEISSAHLKYELGRGLLTGLLLCVIYLFVRGAAFMAGSVTGERERRAWDQIALTGMAPETYVAGKLAAVLLLPLRQMLVASPALALFAIYDVISWSQLVMVVALLSACFVAAGCLGMAISTFAQSSHQAQGWALMIGAGVLLLPLAPFSLHLVALMLLAGAFINPLLKARLSPAGACLVLGGGLLVAVVGGSSVSPIAAVLSVADPVFVTSSMAWAMGGAANVMLCSTLSMLLLAGLLYYVAVGSLEQGGSVKP